MGATGNHLCFDLVEESQKRNPGASICAPEGVGGFKDAAILQDYHVLPQFRNAMAKFMGKVRGDRVRFDPDRIVMVGGAAGAHEIIGFCLVDPDEALLVPTSYYPGYYHYLSRRVGVKLVPIECDSANNFKLRMEDLEAAYEMAKQNNIQVKGLLLTNPSNPSGTILDGDTLRSIAAFTNENNIHLICDDVYSAGKPDYVSIAEIVDEDRKSGGSNSLNLDLIHIVHSLSKDMGFTGLQAGIIYSYSDVLVNCARKFSFFGLVPAQAQHVIGSVLSDEELMVELFLGAKTGIPAEKRRSGGRNVKRFFSLLVSDKNDGTVLFKSCLVSRY
ncbi:unnamed protein product [Linum tenue]|uniref:Aminotransferase class I/classII large domain-containing protein n=1 Tax=Linum tenue TaxID=586396 RepID=A0AAV0LUC7_9ROSI|nr:unnamed protein product [Linum tenue]